MFSSEQNFRIFSFFANFSQNFAIMNFEKKMQNFVKKRQFCFFLRKFSHFFTNRIRKNSKFSENIKFRIFRKTISTFCWTPNFPRCITRNKKTEVLFLKKTVRSWIGFHRNYHILCAN